LTHEDMIRMMQGNMQQQPQIDVPVEKIDEFIKRSIDELNYNEHTLHQACMWKLYGKPEAPNYVVVSEAELQILPLVVRRLEGEGK
jgi:hypothetical protein